jgi:mandelate racemase
MHNPAARITPSEDGIQSGIGARDPLVVRALRTTPVLLPLQRQIKTAAGTVTHAPLVLIDLETDQGVTGTAYVFTFGQIALKPVQAAIEALASLIIGQPVVPVVLEDMLRSRFRLLGDQGLVGIGIAAVDMAAWDALARAAGIPLARFLGGTPRPIAVYASLGMDGCEAGIEQAAEAREQGFKAIKIKIGYPTLAEDLAVIHGVKSVIGDDIGLLIDYNQSLNVPEAIRRCHVLDAEGLVWIEEPTLQEDYEGHARIAAAIKSPIQLGENWYGWREMARAVAASASDLVMMELMKIGGVSGWLRGARIAEIASRPVSAHIFQEVSAHLMCVTPGAHFLEYVTLADPILTHPLQLKDGMAIVRDAPGSGLDWDLDAVRHFAPA